MNSSKVRKRRRKVIVSRHKLSSSTRCLSLLNIGNNKRRITTLLKNNKTLALALQDARCDLSTKQALLENASKHFKNMMQARINLLEMYSTLKSLMKCFDNTLLLLKVDDGTKICDLTVPFKSCSKFKNKMKELAETIEGVSEENLFPTEQITDNDNSIIKNSFNQMLFDNPSTSNMNCVPMEVTEVVDKVRSKNKRMHGVPFKVSKEDNPVNSKNTLGTNLEQPLLFCENSKGLLDPTKNKQIISTESDSLKDRESSETPELNIPKFKPLSYSTKASSDVKSCLAYETASCIDKNSSKISKPTVHPASLKVMNSKIPRFQDVLIKSKTESNSSDVKCKVLRGRILNVTKKHDKNICRRKTFVINNSDCTVTNPESTVLANDEEMSDKNNSNAVKDLEKINRRKTYVKIPDISENNQPRCEKRKTFVKKSDDKIKPHNSIETKRNTFVLSEVKQNCNSHCENVTTDVEKLGLVNNEVKTDKELLPISRNLIENTKLSSYAIMNPLQNHSQDNQLVKIPMEKLNKSRTQMKESLNSHCENVTTDIGKLGLVNNEVETDKELLPISKNLIEDTKMSYAIMNPLHNHSQDNQLVTISMEKSNESTTKMKESDLEKGNTNGKDEKIKLFETELFTEGVLTCNSANKIKEIEIIDTVGTCQSSAQHVIQSNEEDIKILAINESKRGSKKCKHVSYKMYLESDSDCESIPELDLKFLNEEPSIKSIPIRRKISQSKKKKVFVFNTHKKKSLPSKKSVSKRSKIAEDHSEILRVKKNEKTNTPCEKEEILQIAANDVENIKNTLNVKESQNNASETTVLSNSENIKKNISLHSKYSPVITSDKFLNAIERESDNLDSEKSEEHIINEISEGIKCNARSNKVRKNNKIKNLASKSNVPTDDLISVKKNGKKKYSRKQSKEISGNFSEEKMNDLVVKNKIEVKSKKQNNKAKAKSKKKAEGNMTEDNTIVVQAEVHPLPRFLTMSEAEILSKENNEKPTPQNYQVSVVLSDILQTKNVDMLTISCKDKILSGGKNLKTPLSENSNNILKAVEENTVSKNEGNSANVFQEVKSKRTRGVSYAEPSLRKKMRQ